MTTQRFSLSTALPSAVDDRDRHIDGVTIWTVERTVHDLLHHAHERSERLLWSTFTARVARLEQDLPPVVSVSIAGVIEDGAS